MELSSHVYEGISVSFRINHISKDFQQIAKKKKKRKQTYNIKQNYKNYLNKRWN